MTERKAKIYVLSQFAGILYENDKGYVFAYEESYRQNPADKFDNAPLIPEGWLLDIACSPKRKREGFSTKVILLSNATNALRNCYWSTNHSNSGR
jgi:hypothetical protein